MGDCSVEARLAGLGRIDMDTFHVACDGGEVSDSALTDLMPAADPQFTAKVVMKLARISELKHFPFLTLAERVHVF